MIGAVLRFAVEALLVGLFMSPPHVKVKSSVIRMIASVLVVVGICIVGECRRDGYSKRQCCYCKEGS